MAGENDMTGYRLWAVDNVVYGPVELPVLVGWIQERRVLADSWIFAEQSASWQRAADIPELRMFFEPQTAAGSLRDAEVHVPLVPGIKPAMLRRVKVLGEMNDQQLGRFVEFMELQHVRQWMEVVKQGSPGDSMYLVLEGELRVRLMIANKETILVTLSAGEFFGEIALFDHGPRSADVVANTDSVLLKISARAFHELATRAPELATPFLRAICRTLTSRIRADDRRISESIAFARSAAGSF
jgi:CRP-like cAMP-binding protein